MATEDNPAASGTAGTTQPLPEKPPFPPFDSTYFASQFLWFAICFVALYVLVAKVVVPRIGGILAKRRGTITGDLAAAERAKEESEAANDAYEKALAAARGRALSIAEKARNEAKAAADAERARTEAELAKRLAEAETRIGAIKSRALSEVGTIASDAAGEIVRVLAGASAGAPEIEAAVGAAMTGRAGRGN